MTDDQLPTAPLARQVAALTERCDRLEQRITAVDALHERYEGTAYHGPWCGHDNEDWPCVTHRALHPEDSDAPNRRSPR